MITDYYPIIIITDYQCYGRTGTLSASSDVFCWSTVSPVVFVICFHLSAWTNLINKQIEVNYTKHGWCRGTIRGLSVDFESDSQVRPPSFPQAFLFGSFLLQSSVFFLLLLTDGDRLMSGNGQTAEMIRLFSFLACGQLC